MARFFSTKPEITKKKNPGGQVNQCLSTFTQLKNGLVITTRAPGLSPQLPIDKGFEQLAIKTCEAELTECLQNVTPSYLPTFK